MQTQSISARFRPGSGKGTARKLRAEGRIPVVVYGGGGDPIALDLDPRELTNLRKKQLGWNTPVSIAVDGGEDIQLALLKDVQRHPVSGDVIHADLLRVDAEAIGPSARGAGRLGRGEPGRVLTSMCSRPWITLHSLAASRASGVPARVTTAATSRSSSCATR